MRNQNRSIDDGLVNLELPADPAQVAAALDALTAGCDGYDFVADRGARKARDCWIATRFLIAHGQRTARQYEVTRVITEAPDLEYREITQPRRPRSIEAAEILSPDRKRSEEYLKRKWERELCEQAGREYKPPLKSIPHEAIEADRQAFPHVATEILEDKLTKDYGLHCTLVLYVSLWLFDDEPIRNFLTTYRPSMPVRFDEIWFLSSRTIIPLIVH